MAKDESVLFEEFIEFFPEVKPPFTLTEESIDLIKEVNKYLPEIMIKQFISKWEPDVDESITEFFPCLRLPSTDHYDALVYWKASLMRYEYILITLDKSHSLISQKIISGVFVDDQVIKKSAARIDEDNIIHIMVGATFDEGSYDPANSQSVSMEIMINGEIVVDA